MMCWTRSGTPRAPDSGTAGAVPQAVHRRQRRRPRSDDGSLPPARIDSRRRPRRRQFARAPARASATAQKLDEYFTSVRDVEQGLELRNQLGRMFPSRSPTMKEPVERRPRQRPSGSLRPDRAGAPDRLHAHRHTRDRRRLRRLGARRFKGLPRAVASRTGAGEASICW